MVSIQKFVFDKIVARPVSETSLTSLFFSPVLVHVVIALHHFASIVVHRVYWRAGVFFQADRLFCLLGLSCIWHGILNVFVLTWCPEHNATNCLFSRRVSAYFCSRLYFPIVHLVTSFVDWFVYHVYNLSLCKFANGVSVASLRGTIFQIWSLPMVAPVGETSITLNGPVFGASAPSWIQSSATFGAEVVLGGRLRLVYCPEKNDSYMLQLFRSWWFRVVGVTIPFYCLRLPTLLQFSVLTSFIIRAEMLSLFC